MRSAEMWTWATRVGSMCTSGDRRWAPSLVLLTLLLAAGCDRSRPTSESDPVSERVETLLAEQAGLLESGRLRIGLARLEDGELKAILADHRVGPLTEVHLTENRLTDAAVDVLLKSPKTADLERLTLAEKGVGDRGVARLLGAPRIAGLRALDLSHTRAAPGTYANLDPRRLIRLDTLRLIGTQLDGRVVKPLLELPAVRVLELGHTGLTASAARALLSQVRAESLGLGSNRLGPGALVGLERFAPGLDTVDLQRNQLSTADVVHLAGLPDAPRALDLGHTTAGEAGLTALTRAPWLGDMQALVVIDTTVSAEAKAALRAAWGERGGLTL